MEGSCPGFRVPGFVFGDLPAFDVQSSANGFCVFFAKSRHLSAGTKLNVSLSDSAVRPIVELLRRRPYSDSNSIARQAPQTAAELLAVRTIPSHLVQSLNGQRACKRLAPLL